MSEIKDAPSKPSKRRLSRAGRFSRAVANFMHEWPAHILTFALIVAVVVMAPRQSTLFIYKAALPMIGACMGYWLDVFFFERKHPCRGDLHRRWQLVALMCAGMLTMGMAA